MQKVDRDEIKGGADVVLSARDVAKSFGNVHALKGVDFDIYRGQVTTLFGENGAGRSTLMKILSGVITPTAGDILFEGRSVRFGSTAEAQALGISIIHQELSLAPHSACLEQEKKLYDAMLITPDNVDRYSGPFVLEQ